MLIRMWEYLQGEHVYKVDLLHRCILELTIYLCLECFFNFIVESFNYFARRSLRRSQHASSRFGVSHKRHRLLIDTNAASNVESS